MADNIDVTPGSGKTVATDDVSGVQFQKIKIDVGADGVSAPLSATDTVPTTIYSSGTEVDFTAPVEVLGSGVAGTPATGVVTVQGVASMTPLMTGGVYNTASPSLSNGQETPRQVDQRGNVKQSLWGPGSNNFNSFIGAQDDLSFPGQAMYVFNSLPYSFDGTTWDINRSIQDGTNVPNGKGVQAVVAAPTNQAAQAIAPVARTTAGSSQMLKGSAGNLYSLNVVSGASAGVVYVFNATALPPNGAVTPVKAYILAANSSLEVKFDPPLRLGTGITVGFGTGTDPFALTASATAFISGEAL